MMQSGRWKDYTLLTLFLVIVWGFTFRFSGDTDVVSHISLASTLVSLVLSVIAILYTLYQSTAASSQTDRLTGASLQLSESAAHISDTVKSLRDVQTQATALVDASAALSAKVEEVGKVATDVKEIRTQVSALESATATLLDSSRRIAESIADVERLKAQIAQSVESTVRSELSPIRQDLGGLSKQLTNSNERKSNKITEDLDSRMSDASNHGLAGLYLLVQARTNHSVLPFDDIMDKVPSLRPDYVHGFIVGFTAGTKYNPVRYKPKFIEVSRFDDRLTESVTAEVQSRFDLGIKLIVDIKPLIDAVDWTVPQADPGKEAVV